MRKPRMALHSVRLLAEIDNYIRSYNIRGESLTWAASDVLDGAVFNHEIEDLIRRRYLRVVREWRSPCRDHCGDSWTVRLSARAMRLFWPARMIPQTSTEPAGGEK